MKKITFLLQVRNNRGWRSGWKIVGKVGKRFNVIVHWLSIRIRERWFPLPNPFVNNLHHRLMIRELLAKWQVKSSINLDGDYFENIGCISVTVRITNWKILFTQNLPDFCPTSFYKHSIIKFRGTLQFSINMKTFYINTN